MPSTGLIAAQVCECGLKGAEVGESRGCGPEGSPQVGSLGKSYCRGATSSRSIRRRRPEFIDASVIELDGSVVEWGGTIVESGGTVGLELQRWRVAST